MRKPKGRAGVEKKEEVLARNRPCSKLKAVRGLGQCLLRQEEVDEEKVALGRSGPVGSDSPVRNARSKMCRVQLRAQRA